MKRFAGGHGDRRPGRVRGPPLSRSAFPVSPGARRPRRPCRFQVEKKNPWKPPQAQQRLKKPFPLRHRLRPHRRAPRPGVFRARRRAAEPDAAGVRSVSVWRPDPGRHRGRPRSRPSGRYSTASSPSWDVPFFYVPGNHDFANKALAKRWGRAVLAAVIITSLTRMCCSWC